MTSKTIGTYELGDELGQAPLGSLFRARSEGKDVLVRVVRGRLPFTKAALDRVASAARHAKTIEHARVAPILDVIEGDPVAIVFGVANGELLTEVQKQAAAQRNAVPLRIATRIVLDLCEAIACAHEKKAADLPAFGGLSPDSALVGPDGVTRLLDAFAAPAAIQSLESSPRFVAYQSPEHFSKSPLTAASDVFSLGTIAWELVVNRALFGSTSLAEVRRRVNAPVKRADTAGIVKRADLTPLANVLDRALQGNPSKRYA